MTVFKGQVPEIKNLIKNYYVLETFILISFFIFYIEYLTYLIMTLFLQNKVKIQKMIPGTINDSKCRKFYSLSEYIRFKKYPNFIIENLGSLVYSTFPFR
ncbi:hypothetical protein BpHYR1_051408 [Brachionus plicatilis]|uniref:Uncharacterized protein n=1 Tax=Brachionus plicatilis TaxID=10195 RepID=A0A3M7S214_BRAPC|nr:hypothetical protein BpHYR1_051408 [Brachionus plicatilis]